MLVVHEGFGWQSHILSKLIIVKVQEPSPTLAFGLHPYSMNAADGAGLSSLLLKNEGFVDPSLAIRAIGMC